MVTVNLHSLKVCIMYIFQVQLVSLEQSFSFFEIFKYS